MVTVLEPLDREIRSDIAQAERSDRPIRRVLRRARAWVAMHPHVDAAYRIGVGALGGVISVGGLLLVPLPGPGWLIVFLGLAILGTEFRWARRVAAALKRALARFWAWWTSRKDARRAV